MLDRGFLPEKLGSGYAFIPQAVYKFGCGSPQLSINFNADLAERDHLTHQRLVAIVYRG